ncbi:MAG: Rpn family recombination-promoting nuclease/putative transposase [Clostridiaceae bacterium]|nr:Rpn family recombination-promoting nuclease/putative transposase [Clostridiaceae bacterium]
MSEKVTYNKHGMKPLSELTLLDRFLFSCAMEDPRILELSLRIIMEQELELQDSPQTEKEFRTMPWLRSIRLDVFAVDLEEKLYNTEVQKKNTGNLLKRSRFYQALIDSSLLSPGEIDFNQLPEVYLIMIAPFDLFGEGKYRYTFRMKCEESEDLWLEDGVTRIFLNTRGSDPEGVSQELIDLLHYFETTSEQTAQASGSEAIQEIHSRVQQLKESEQIGVRYMQEWEERAYEKMEAKEEGREEGREEGIRALIEDNLEEGIGKERIIKKVMKRFLVTEQKAKEYYERFAAE